MGLKCWRLRFMTILSWHHRRAICGPYSFVEHDSHFFSWTWPQVHLDQTESPYNLFFFRQRGIHCHVHSDFFLSANAPQLYCPLDCDLGAVYDGLWRVQQFSHRDPLCIPRTETPFLSLTHRDHHSFLIRGGGGGRVAYTAAGQLLLNRKTFWVW